MTSWSWSGHWFYFMENHAAVWWAIGNCLNCLFQGTVVLKIQKAVQWVHQGSNKQYAERAWACRADFKQIYGLLDFWSSGYFRKPLLYFFNDNKCMHISSRPPSLPCASVTAGRQLSGICKNPTVLFCEVLTKAECCTFHLTTIIRKRQINTAGEGTMCT